MRPGMELCEAMKEGGEGEEPTEAGPPRVLSALWLDIEVVDQAMKRPAGIEPLTRH